MKIGKYLLMGLLIIIGLAIGVFIGLGKFAGLEWVLIIVLFPLMYIFGTILFGKSSKEEEPEDEEERNWKRHE